MNTPQKKGDQVTVEAVSFSRLIGAEEGQGVSVKRESDADNTYGLTPEKTNNQLHRFIEPVQAAQELVNVFFSMSYVRNNFYGSAPGGHHAKL